VFDADRLGSLVVGALQADIDYRADKHDGRPSVEFSWVGDDAGHPASGRGWAQVQPDNTIRVKLYIHSGDEVTMIGAKPHVSDAAKRIAASCAAGSRYLKTGLVQRVPYIHHGDKVATAAISEAAAH